MTTITLNPHSRNCIGSANTKTAKQSAFKAIAKYFAQRRQRRIDRDAFRHMLTLDQAMLDDIGVSKEDIRWANSLPLNTNASLELQKLSLQNRGY